MAERKDRQSGVLGSAGRSAVQLLRRTGTRAKLGSLHLPLTLHGFRQQPIILAAPRDDDAAPTVEALPAASDPPVEPPAHTRALRGRLGATERRVARLRHALERERQARALSEAALRNPQPLIDQLAADLAALPSRDKAVLRATIGSVLAAYGFQVQTAEDARGHADGETAPGIPGWDRARIEALTLRLQAERPELGGRRSIHLCLEGLARQGTLTAAQLAASADLTSPMARHRLRLTLEALCDAGVARRAGPRFTLLPPAGISVER
ncbi:MAG: hypothetical protein ACRDG4_10120 [Chloroflexota bacterium]